MSSDERLREAYERGLPQGETRPPLDDLAAERLRRVIDREGSDAERLHTLDQLLSSAEGRRDLEIAWAAARAARPPARRWGRWSAAAGLLLVAGLGGFWMATRGEREEPLRGTGSPVTLLAPLGSRPARDAARFVWRPVREAERYTLVVVDEQGNDVYAAETTDTALALPDSVRLRSGQSYLWWVQARTTEGVTLTAVTARLSIVTRPE